MLGLVPRPSICTAQSVRGIFHLKRLESHGLLCAFLISSQNLHQACPSPDRDPSRYFPVSGSFGEIGTPHISRTIEALFFKNLQCSPFLLGRTISQPFLLAKKRVT